MKRTLAAVIALALVLAIPFAAVEAAGSGEKGELLITQEPEKIQGQVGEIVKVNFYLYPNLPDGRKLDSLSGTMKYDPEFVTLGAINQKDEEQNLTTLMKGKASVFLHNIKADEGLLMLAFSDPYGVEKSGFWFQAEFRIEKEGATDFVFNGITYTGIDDEYIAITFVIDPVSVGGIYTEGQTVPEDGAAEQTFAPLTPAVETPAAPTATPRPSNSAQPVPIASTLPTYSAKPTASGIVTPAPAVTKMPAATSAPQADTPEPEPEPAETPVPVGETPEPVIAPTSAEPVPATETTPFPIEGDTTPPEATSEATAPIEPAATSEPAQPSDETVPDKQTETEEKKNDIWLIIGLIAGMVAVVGLGALAIVLLLKRRKMNEQ